MDKGVLNKIINSGLRQITIGLETGNERMANFIKKGKNHVEKFKECARILSEHDVIMASGLIFGMPTETIDELKETIKYVEEIRAINKNFRLSTTFWKPLPGTELTEFIKKNYGYKEPSSLKGWAELGAGNHFEYNTWMDNPWIENQGEYRAIYNKFKQDNQDIFI
ncbi:MAG: radical SAM protein, partial [Candidatus Omnitrophota bacterium]